MADEDGAGRKWWTPDLILWHEVYSALQKILAIVVLTTAHVGLSYVINWSASGNDFPIGARILRIYFFVAIGAVDVRLVADIVLLFVAAPWNRQAKTGA